MRQQHKRLTDFSLNLTLLQLATKHTGSDVGLCTGLWKLYRL